MEDILPVFALTVLSGAFLFGSRLTHRKEGFGDIINPDVESSLGTKHSDFIRRGAEKYNPLMNLINPQNNVLLSPDYTPDEASNVQNTVRSALGIPKASAENPSFSLQTNKITDSILINKTSKGTAKRAIIDCQKIKDIDCNKFDDQNFAFNCGICHEEGRDSGGNPSLGGLYVSEDDITTAEVNASRMNARTANYQPSVGKCKPYRFSTSKEQCLRIKAEMECSKKQSFDVPGCSQCFQDDTFRYLPSNLLKEGPTFILVGSGSLIYSKVGDTTQTKKIELSDKPSKVELDIQEGDVVIFEVSPESATLAGYLIGTTSGGDFRVDINRLVQSDLITGSRPRLSGFSSIDGENYTQMRPGRGKTSMKLSILNTFTFLEPTEAEAGQCASAPFITKQSNAEFLANSPCYKKGQGPGKYSLECLQQTFESAGCTSSGTGYPSNAIAAQALMTGDSGAPLSIGQIADMIYKASLLSYTGTQPNGQKLTIPGWSKVSEFCTGRVIRSPCDLDPSSGGPLSTDCLSYLWQNAGATDGIQGGVGQTYSNTTNTTSLTDKRLPRYCTSKGTMAPINSESGQNDTAIATARTKGGVSQVKDFYNMIHKKANDNTLTDSQRKEAITQCYGIELNELKADTEAGGGGMCVPQTIVPQVANPTKGQQQGSIVLNDNYIFTFGIIPRGTVAGFSSVLRVTANDKDGGYPECRLPAFFLYPNRTRLFCQLTSTGGECQVSSSMDLPVNQETIVVVKVINGVLSMTLSGPVTDEQSMAIPGKNVTGPATIYSGDPYYTPFVGSLNNISFCTFAGSYPSVLDSKSGRTKSSFKKLQGIQVVEASYGLNCNTGLRGNVTGTVKQMANSKMSANIPFNNGVLGDPAYGCYKSGQVIFNCGDGVNKTSNTTENGVAPIQC